MTCPQLRRVATRYRGAGLRAMRRSSTGGVRDEMISAPQSVASCRVGDRTPSPMTYARSFDASTTCATFFPDPPCARPFKVWAHTYSPRSSLSPLPPPPRAIAGGRRLDINTNQNVSADRDTYMHLNGHARADAGESHTQAIQTSLSLARCRISWGRRSLVQSLCLVSFRQTYR